MLAAVSDIFRSAVSLVWPETCIGCGTNEPTREGFCGPCGRKLLSLALLPHCPRCAGTIGPGLAAGEDGCYACPDVMPRFRQVVRVIAAGGNL